MSEEEDNFITNWKRKRNDWKWSKFLKNTTYYITFPIVLIIDFVNFFIVADVSFSFFSFSHIWELIKMLILFSLIITIPYGLFYWYSNELKFQKLNRKKEMEQKKSIRKL